MSQDAFYWQGLPELRAALRALPRQLAGDATAYIRAAAHGTGATVGAHYPVGPRRKGKPGGTLKSRVKVTEEVSAFGAIATVRSTAPHASLFEYGTGARSYRGWNRGRMPAGRTMARAAIPRRRAMYQQLIALVRRAGFEVTGTP